MMTQRRKSSLIYMDNEGYAWIQEHGIGQPHPKDAEFYCEIPAIEDKRWKKGKPQEDNVQFLTLCPFYPSQRLDVSIEINRTPKIMQYVNHPAFEGCVQYMDLGFLDFKVITPYYMERAIYTIGLCHHGHQEAYKTVEVKADDKMKAMEKGRKLLNPSTVEHVTYVGVRPNEEYDTYQNKKPKIKM